MAGPKPAFGANLSAPAPACDRPIATSAQARCWAKDQHSPPHHFPERRGPWQGQIQGWISAKTPFRQGCQAPRSQRPRGGPQHLRQGLSWAGQSPPRAGRRWRCQRRPQIARLCPAIAARWVFVWALASQKAACQNWPCQNWVSTCQRRPKAVKSGSRSGLYISFPKTKAPAHPRQAQSKRDYRKWRVLARLR